MASKKSKQVHLCTVCGNTFANKANLERHIGSVHFDKTYLKNFTCYHCERNFNSKFSLMRHILKCTQKKRHPRDNADCPLCNFRDSRPELLKHYASDHQINLSVEQLKFHSFRAFEDWKEEIERLNISRYVKGNTLKTKRKLKFYYKCHREGNYKSCGRNIRQLKVSGSNKINGYCPSKIDVTLIKETGELHVMFVPTHVGHQLEADKIPLKKAERDLLAAKLYQKISFDEILNNIKDKVGDYKFERPHLITRKVLFNIEKLYNIKSVRHSYDCTSIDSWVKDIYENGCQSVIRFYKRQEDCKCEYPELGKDDFLLIIMNEVQLETLKNYGYDCVCVDSTRSLSGYNFELIMVMVIDDLRQGFPCLFAFCNRTDDVIFKIIFEVLRNAIGDVLTPAIFMSDMTNQFHNVWSEVMGPIPNWLFCTWHVIKDWKKNIDTKIKNAEKQTSIYSTLRVLLEEQDEVTFEINLKNFLESTETDLDLTNFGQYFLKNYYLNRKSWAYCYRLNTNLNTNKHLEQMHCTLKHIYSKVKTVKRLDKAINDIMKLVKDKLYEKHLVSQKVKISSKLNEIREIHKLTEEVKSTAIISEENGNWLVSSVDGSEACTIERSKPDCKCKLRCIECDLCIHAYVCSCPDSSIKWNMCRHIHQIVLQQQYSKTPEPPQETEIEIAFEELGDSVSPVPETNPVVEDIESYKARLLEQFQSILQACTTWEECSNIEKTLVPLKTNLLCDRFNQYTNIFQL